MPFASIVLANGAGLSATTTLSLIAIEIVLVMGALLAVIFHCVSEFFDLYIENWDSVQPASNTRPQMASRVLFKILPPVWFAWTEK